MKVCMSLPDWMLIHLKLNWKTETAACLCLVQNMGLDFGMRLM